MSDRYTYIKKAIYIVMSFLAVVITFYLYLPKHNGMIQNMNVTIGKDHAQVVCVGSSHIYSGINPIQMYDEYGIAAYDIACGSMAPWQQYYYIKQVIKYQHPEIMIIDVYTTKDNIENFTDGRAVVNLLDFPFSTDKWKAIMASDVDRPLDLMLVFPYTYDKYQGLCDYTGMTMLKNPGEKSVNMGAVVLTGVEKYDEKSILDASSLNGIEAIPEKNEKYLRKSIEYCKENGTNVILVNAPWPDNNIDSQKKFNYMQMVADEYEVKFINGCLCDDDIDYATDIYGDGGHLNIYGVTKFTRLVSEYIANQFDLKDCRDNPEYQVYEEAVVWYRNTIALQNDGSDE